MLYGEKQRTFGVLADSQSKPPRPLSNIKIGAFWVKIKEILMGVSEPFSQVLGPVLQLTDLSVKSTIQ